MEKVIEVRGLVKRFGNKVAVDGLDLDVYNGEIFAFLGPNGAGKTTTVRVLSTLTDFDEGLVKVDGYDIREHPNQAKRRMGVIQQHISLDKDLTVWENMMQHTMYHKIPKSERHNRIDGQQPFGRLEETSFHSLCIVAQSKDIIPGRANSRSRYTS